MQAIEAPRDLASRIRLIEGQLKIMVIFGVPRLVIGEVMICDHSKPFCVMADIAEINSLSICNIEEDCLSMLGFTSREEMVENLKVENSSASYYSMVTIITLRNIRGTMTLGKQSPIGKICG